MAKSTDWMPPDRTGQLSMSRKWINALNSRGASWNIASAQITELEGLADEAQTALTIAMNKAPRTPVATANCRTAFDALAALMQSIKNHYFAAANGAWERRCTSRNRARPGSGERMKTRTGC